MLFEKNSILMMTGDSITDADRARPVGENNTIGNGYVNLTNIMLKTAYPEENYKILNTGISGNSMLQLEARWQSDVLDYKPDYVSVLIGVNDMNRTYYNENDPCSPDEYITSYRNAIEKTKPFVKQMILFTPFLVENDNDVRRPFLQKYIDIVKSLAKEYNLIMVDFQAEFDKYIKKGISKELLAPDKVHPTQLGAMIMAKAFLRTIEFDFNLL